MDLFFIILPVFLIFSIGFIGQKWIGFNIKSISTVAIYLMSPFLAFRTFYTNPLTMDYVTIFIFCITLMSCLLMTVFITGKLMKATNPQLSAMILSSVFMNSGNYGVPVILFAFGAVGFDYAVVMMVFQSLLMNTIGLFFASIGGQDKATFKQSFQKVIRMPLIYAAIAGIILQISSVIVPTPFIEAIHLVADASIPTVMLVLGMQLAAIQKKKVAYRFVSAAAVIRMVISPLIAMIVLSFLPMNDLLKTILIIQSAMPTAANTTMFAVHFETEADLVSFTTFITTLISLITVPVVLFILGV